jgi:hypothetical protein
VTKVAKASDSLDLLEGDEVPETTEFDDKLTLLPSKVKIFVDMFKREPAFIKKKPKKDSEFDYLNNGML